MHHSSPVKRKSGECRIREGEAPEAGCEGKLEIHWHQPQLHQHHQYRVARKDIRKQIDSSTGQYEVRIARYNRRRYLDRQGRNERCRKHWAEEHPMVQRFKVVDNSNFSPIRLTVPLDSPYPSFIKELSLLPISNSEDLYSASCVRVPARGLPPLPSGAALAS